MASVFKNSFIQDPLQGCPAQRMAEEVRCPIWGEKRKKLLPRTISVRCRSGLFLQGLLKRASSLSCNHVFCNSCILQYIKNISSCPVCKMPVGRREVLLTPHMDILVNIYRSMEMAAGISLFDPQPAPPLGSPDHVEDGKQAELDCAKNLKRKSPETSKRLHRKVKGSCGQNQGQKRSRPAGAASKAFDSENSPMLKNFDDDIETVATGNLSTQNSQPLSNVHRNLNLDATGNSSAQNPQLLSNVHTNLDLDPQNSSRMLDQVSKPPRNRQACSKVKQAWLSSLACNWVFCCSATDDSEKEQVADFASLTGATLLNMWCSAVTHVIAGTDEHGAAKRTPKFLMAILEGKWVVNSDWITACTKAGHPVEEGPFEVTHDIHGIYSGTRHSRVLAAKKTQKLFKGLRFYFSGEFSPASKADLQALILAAGGAVLDRRPIVDHLEASEVKHSTVVLYSVEFPEGSRIRDKNKEVQCRYMEAKSLADAVQAQVEAHSWLLNSVASCQLQCLSQIL